MGVELGLNVKVGRKLCKGVGKGSGLGTILRYRLGLDFIVILFL